MPFAPYIARSVLRSVVGVFARAASDYSRGLRASRAPSEEWVRNWIMREYGHNQGANASTAGALARRAQTAYEGAVYMRRYGHIAPADSRHGRDPGIERGDEPYRYEILVQRIDANGTVTSFMSEYRSDVPMSADQIQAQVEQHTQNYGYVRNGVKTGLAPIAQGESVSVTVIAAYRRDR